MLPASVEETEEEAFHRNQLQEVVFGSGSRLRVVGNYAFGASWLDSERVHFPENTRVSKKAFAASLIEWLIRWKLATVNFRCDRIRNS